MHWSASHYINLGGDVYEAALRSLLCSPEGLKELLEVVSKFLSSLSSNQQCPFLTGQ